MGVRCGDNTCYVIEALFNHSSGSVKEVAISTRRDQGEILLNSKTRRYVSSILVIIGTFWSSTNTTE
ncbi:hypothetical protein AcW1_001600 [Taiwanofungus camphoratus]|nr:hypothetical protein AcV7_003550 [Antrodia cinnamomea]KAI0938747.1 hypothetical protein AcV5_000358 [Antrodia cinnamomea]KAI0945357.1 hypothetical protein AcW1_001600 [Antrodia cinnamomea]